MVSAFVLLLGLSTSTSTQVSVRQEAYETLNKRIRQIYLETFPGTKNLVRGKEATQMMQRLSSETASTAGSTKWPPEVGSGCSHGLTQKVSAHKDVSLDNVAVEGGKINLDGRASSFQNVDSLKARLGEAGPSRTSSW